MTVVTPNTSYSAKVYSVHLLVTSIEIFGSTYIKFYVSFKKIRTVHVLPKTEVKQESIYFTLYLAKS